MNTTFKIPISSNEIANNILIEIGKSNIAILCYSTFPFQTNGFYYLSIANNDSIENIANDLKVIITSEILQATVVEDVFVFYNYSNSTLVPTSHFNVSTVDDIASLMFGNKIDNIVKHEKVANQTIENIYAVPIKIKNTLQNIFPAAIHYHSLSKLIQNKNGSVLTCTIYDSEIRVILYKENLFKIASYFDYNTPEDVCYHVLNICERFEINPNEIEIILNGMVDVSSNLYREIHKYFLKIKFEEQPPKVILANGFEEIANHFYTSLIHLAKCVS